MGPVGEDGRRGGEQRAQGCTVGAARRRQRRRAQVVAGSRWGSNVGNLLAGDAVLLPAAVLSVFLLVVAAGL